jgi:AMP-activated protein kinase-like protein
MNLNPLIQRLLDGEIQVADLPPELRPEGERALRLVSLAASDPVTLAPRLEQRVMAAVRQRAAAPHRSAWRWLWTPREVRLRIRPWLLGPALAALAGIWFLTGRAPVPPAADGSNALVRFVFYAPNARAVTVAGSFNDWSPSAAPLARVENGVWTVTLTLPLGQHQYAFVVDGQRWVADPAAPAVDDGFGRRNSVVAVNPQGTIL